MLKLMNPISVVTTNTPGRKLGTICESPFGAEFQRFPKLQTRIREVVAEKVKFVKSLFCKI